MKQRKVPLRKCVVTNERLPKKELIRIVRTSENDVFVDETGKKNGRGAYVKLEKKVVDQAKKTKILNRQLELDVPERIYDELYTLLDERKTSE